MTKVIEMTQDDKHLKKKRKMTNYDKNRMTKVAKMTKMTKM